MICEKVSYYAGKPFLITIIDVDNGTSNESHADGVTHLLRTTQTLVDHQDKCGVIVVQVMLGCQNER